MYQISKGSKHVADTAIHVADTAIHICRNSHFAKKKKHSLKDFKCSTLFKAHSMKFRESFFLRKGICYCIGSVAFIS